uniref:Uncharacterized protein n=1 Tax=Leptobrachium leishanense TaxID=445787 RepID=A0A8C5WGN8_9ANUR
MIWFLPQISWWWLLGFLLLVAPHPGASWYKHSASPRYHTVGRASGLLIGVRRSPYLWRRDLEGAEGVYGLLEEPDTGHLLYPGPDEVGDVKEEGFQWKTGREVEERKVEEMIRGLQEHEKERSILDEVKRQVQVSKHELSKRNYSLEEPRSKTGYRKHNDGPGVLQHIHPLISQKLES